MKKLHQRGDTIMEVLICTAIIGMVMTSAFILSNRSTATNRSAYERAEATSIAESQLEMLRHYAEGGSLPLINASLPFCLNNSAAKVEFSEVPPADAQADTALEKYPSDCRVDSSAGQYRFAIWPPGLRGDRTTQYMVTVRWASPLGDNIEQLELFYELYNLPSLPFGGTGAVTPNPFVPTGIDRISIANPARGAYGG